MWLIEYLIDVLQNIYTFTNLKVKTFFMWLIEYLMDML